MTNFKIQNLFRVFSIFIAIVLLWNNSFELYPDGICYLDVADLFIKNGWSGLVHPYWSPLYPLCLAILKIIFHPSAFWLIPATQILNFLLFILLLFSFDLFLSKVITVTRHINTDNGSTMLLPDWALIIIGYSLFVWSFVALCELWKQVPDTIVAICFYLASYFLLKIRFEKYNYRNFIAFGFILGAGFLAKPIMLLLEVVYIITLLFYFKNNLKSIITGIVILTLTSGVCIIPYVISLSFKQGYFTVGDSGKLNYIWYVNGIKQFTHWQGECPTSTIDKNNCSKIGKPIHPTRKIYAFPTVYEFDGEGGTYPPWFNPVYWYAGAKPYVNLKGHLLALKTWNAEDKKTFFVGLSGGLFVLLAYLILLYVSGNVVAYFKRLSIILDLFIPSCVIFLLAFFVNFNTRYVGHFVVLFWLPLIIPITIVSSREMIRLLKILILLVIITPTYSGFAVVKNYSNQNKNKKGHVHWVVATYLDNMGVKEGDKVVYFGNPWWAAWAKLASVKIVAEIYSQKEVAGPFWNQKKEIMEKIIQTISNKTEAKVIVAQKAPSIAKNLGWKNIPNTPYYVYDLRQDKK